MKRQPLVSIVLPTYNGERFLAESIESIIKQTYTNWELIIVNDCSSDNTLNIANSYALKDKRIAVVSNKNNLKLPASLNEGFKNAKGEYYTWTSDDNVYRDNAIEFMVDYLQNHENIDLLSCSFDFVDEQKKFIRKFFDGNTRYVEDLAYRCNIGACFMYTSNISKKVGKYDESKFCAEDYDYWCRIALVGNIEYVNENLYIYRMNEKSLTATKQDIIKKRSAEINLKYCVPILKKYGISKRNIVKQAIYFYFSTKNFEWIIKALKISPINLVIYYFEIIFQKFYVATSTYFILKYTKTPTLLWGASIYLEDMLRAHKIKNKNIVGIIDKDSKKWGIVWYGYNIYSPNKIQELNAQQIIFTIKNNNAQIFSDVRDFVKEKAPEIKTVINIFSEKLFEII